MTTSTADALAIGSLIGSLVGLIIGLGVYVWYALGLSRVFPKLGADGWKGWVPIYNEVEILILGGVPGWSVIFYFIPVVQFYGLYLKVTAVHRINAQFQRGVGMTVLGILLPPVWASILGFGRSPQNEFDQRVGSILPGQPTAGVGPLAAAEVAPTAPVARDASGYVIPSAPAAPIQPAASALPAQPAAEVPQAPTAAPEPTPAPADDSAPAVITNPWAPREAGSPAVPPVVPPPVVPPMIQPPSVAPIVQPPVAAPEPVVVPEPIVAPAPIPVPEPIRPVVPVTESVFPTIDTSSEDTESRPVSLETPIAPIDEDEDAATIVVDRRPRVQWQLVLDDGKSFDLTSDHVTLGRNPASDDPDTQVLAVPDSTRTLSKAHASLLLNGGAWTVTDLNSTNGVIVVNDEDAETLLAPGRSSAVPGRFILGKVGMRITPVDGAGA